MKYKGVMIADIHFGALPVERLYNELEIFLDFIEKKSLDFIVILGDWFDKKINLNSKDAKYSTVFFERICQICIDNDIKLRIIQGTESHDNSQLEVLEILAKNKPVDFKVFYEVEEEELFPDFNVLYVPEEYINSIDEKYGKYMNKKYDMIFGHGMIQEVKFAALIQSSETTMKKAPIFKSKMLCDMCYGPIFFGHIHTKDIFNDRLYYVGSYSRWKFGEEEDKGFYYVKYENDTKEFEAKFIVNNKAMKYDTIEIYEKESGFYKLNTENQIKYIQNLIQSFEYDFLRLQFYIPQGYENENLLINMVNESFGKYKNLKLDFKVNSKIKSKREVEEKINLLLDKYGFIFDNKIDTYTKINKFILEKYNKDISVEKIKEYTI